MYRAKQRARESKELFDDQLRTSLLERVALEADLRRALERDELHVHYQPIVSLGDGAITGVGALQTDLILRLGAWVLEEACA